MKLSGMVRIVLILVLALIGSGCGGGADAISTDLAIPSAQGDPEENPLDIELLRAMSNAGALRPANLDPQDPDKVVLGRLLFFDKVLSGNKDVSCATCHRPATGTTDHLSLSVGTGGVGVGEERVPGERRTFAPRNAPSLFHLSEASKMFWDGRVEKVGEVIQTPLGEFLPSGLDSPLAAQIMLTVISRAEMRGESGDIAVDGTTNELALIADDDPEGQWEALILRLKSLPAYEELFRQAYPDVPVEELGFHHAANAIAAYVLETFTTFDSPFDRYVSGDDNSLTEDQKRGGLLFYGRARCSGCHRGPLLSDFRFHNVAMPQIGPGPGEEGVDLGRAGVTGSSEDRFLFRTPSLRNVELTGPWTHSGAYTTLRAVVEHYRDPEAALRAYDSSQLRGDFRGQVCVSEQFAHGILGTLSPVAGPKLSLSDEEVEQLAEFLASLTDSVAASGVQDIPKSVPSGLPVDP